LLHRGYTVLGHEGDLSGWHSGLWLVPEDRVGIFISINTDDAAFRNEFFMDFMNRFFLYRSSTITSSQDGLSGTEQLLPVGHYKGTYAPTRLAESSISRINMILDDRMQVTLTPNGEGMLTASGSSGSSHFRLRPDGLWLSPYNSFAFHEDSEGLYMQFASSPSIDYRRLAWHEDNGLHTGAISILLFLLLASGSSGIILAIRKRSFGVFLPAASSWLHLAFSIGAIVLSSVDDQGHSWWWSTMFLLLALPVVAVILAACTIVLAAIGKIHLGTRSQRFGWIGGMTLALQFIFAAYLYYWNLFGWFGVESVL